jgi:hypothetical protein
MMQASQSMTDESRIRHPRLRYFSVAGLLRQLARRAAEPQIQKTETSLRTSLPTPAYQRCLTQSLPVIRSFLIAHALSL